MGWPRGGTRVVLPPDVLCADRAVAVEPRKPPAVGVTGGYCALFRGYKCNEFILVATLVARTTLD